MGLAEKEVASGAVAILPAHAAARLRQSLPGTGAVFPTAIRCAYRLMEARGPVFIPEEEVEMVKTASTMKPLASKAPDFSLVNVDGRTVGLAQFEESKALLVVFMCNHCPFVKHVAPELTRLALDYRSKGVAIVGINSNDTAAHPEDSPERMVHEAEERGYPFPYLYDETQEVAKAYGACLLYTSPSPRDS